MCLPLPPPVSFDLLCFRIVILGSCLFQTCIAGDNCLSFIIDGARVTAVDLNPYQLALCELKRAAIMELDHATFFAIFAEQRTDLLRQCVEDKNRIAESCILALLFPQIELESLRYFPNPTPADTMASCAATSAPRPRPFGTPSCRP